jgi:hypothetical protein
MDTIHGLHKVLLGPALPYYSTTCEAATPETAVQLFQEWLPEGQAACNCLTTPLDTPAHRPLSKTLSLKILIKTPSA